MSAKVASLLIDVAADIASLRRDFDQAGKTVQGFGSTVKAVGQGIAAAFSIHEVIAFGERIQDEIDAMADLAENLKIPVEEFQALQNAALLAGQSVEATGAAMAKFNVFIGKASEGNKDAIETLNGLGVTINNLDGSARTTSQRLQLVAQAITSIEDPAKRAAAEVAIFGKSGQSVSAILEQWKRPLGEVNRELQAMGLVHSPEVIKTMADMSDQADRAAKQMDVLFAPFYAMAKSNVLQGIAAAFRLIANAVNAIDAGNLDAIVRTLAALALIPTIVGAPAGIALLQGIKDPLTIVDEQIVTTRKDVDALRQSLQDMSDKGLSNFTDAQKQAALDKYNAALAKLTDLEAKRSGLTGAVVDMSRPPRPGTNPAIVGSGTDKFAEAMRRIREETDGTNKAIAEFQRKIAGGDATKTAERAAKLQQDIANKQSQMMKDLTPDQAATIAPMIKALEELKFRYEEMRRVQGEADAVNRQYGDGLAAQRQAVEDLTELRQLQLIGEREYAAALEDINLKAEQQRLINEGLGEGISQMVAGMQFAASKMAEASSDFQTGQQLFTSSVSIMGDALSEFVTTGSLDFEKLAASFAKMLADMAAQLIIHQALKSILGIGSAAASPAALVGPAGAAPVSGGGFFGWLTGLFGGGRAIGGPVMPGMSYLVGERGPERFVPNVPGQIEASGGGGSGDIGSITVNVDMGQTQGARDPSSALEFGRKLKAAVVDVIQGEQRPGGTLYAR